MDGSGVKLRKKGKKKKRKLSKQNDRGQAEGSHCVTSFMQTSMKICE